MGPKYLLCLLSLWLASCATILNRPYTPVVVHTNQPANVSSDLYTLPTENNRATFMVPRSKKPLHLTVVSDSGQRVLAVPATSSLAYYANILYNYGIGMLVEKDNPKRYTYPRRLYVDVSDTARAYHYAPSPLNKGALLLHLSLPHINSFYLQPRGEAPKANTGFWGFTAGVDYCHYDNRFYSVRASAVTDFFVPFPAAVDISGEYEVMSSAYVALADNYAFKRWMLGYGVCFSSNTWNLQYSHWLNPPPPSRDPVKKTSYALGFYFPLYYRFGEHFFGGLVYRPTVVQFDHGATLKYEHLISMDFGWKVKL